MQQKLKIIIDNSNKRKVLYTSLVSKRYIGLTEKRQNKKVRK